MCSEFGILILNWKIKIQRIISYLEVLGLNYSQVAETIPNSHLENQEDIYQRESINVTKMPPKKNCLKELKNAVTQYNNSVSKCQVVINGKKYEKFEAFQTKLEDKFDLMCQAWEAYKEEILDKGKSEVDFNAENDSGDGPEYKHNDSWKDTREKAFFELFAKLNDDKPVEEQKVNTDEVANLQVLCQQIKTTLELTGNTTIKLIEDVSKLADSSEDETVLDRVVQMINFQRHRVTVELSDQLKQRMKMSDSGVSREFSKDELSQQVHSFSSVQLQKLDELQINLFYKVKPKPAPHTSSSRLTSVPEPSADEVQLAKTKPPFFKGDMVEYPEFKRKWLALVHPANLPAEAELDKLRDAIPKSAKDQLYGSKTLVEAWCILDKRYGNPELIAKKLKDQLKGISVDGKSDPEKVINLQVKVKTLVMQLTTLNMEHALQYDSEFLAAVFNCLPSKYQDKWLDVDKSPNKWNDMLLFLDKIYDQACEQLVLLDTMSKSETGSKNTSVGISAVNASDSAGSKDDEDNMEDIEMKKMKRKRKKLKEEIGACPCCKTEHTFLRKDKINWPSDRLFTCKKYKELTAKERGTLLEKLKGCIRCTSWRHSKASCPGQPAKCSTDKPDGSKCGRDHSYLVHDSGVAYCALATSSAHKDVHITDAEELSQFAEVDINQATAYYMQDIPVKNTKIAARTFYDEGSNRVLIRDEYAAKAGLVK